MAKYGISYQGSKQAIADDIISHLPPADNFYDLFTGGGSIAHAAIVSGKYKNIHLNDISLSVDLFKMAIEGYFNSSKFSPEFITRQEFFNLYKTDPYIKYIWSFGSNGLGYLMPIEDEAVAEIVHNSVVFKRDKDLIEYLMSNQLYDQALFAEYTSHKSGRRLAWHKYCRLMNVPDRLKRLEQLERLERLKRLEGISDNLLITKGSYNKVKILPNSVVYCDIPYNTKSNKSSYTQDFNHELFWRWVRRLNKPVYVSEYWAPSFMEEVWAKGKLSLMGLKQGKRITNTEKLFWNQI